MANPKHLAILEQGVAAWNAWRKDHLNVEPELSQAELVGADLRKADLHKANLHEAKLLKANLGWADLREADLAGADLTRSDLTSAYLLEADLTGAVLSEADLSEAVLGEAVLVGAHLVGANFNGAFLTAANLRGAYLAHTVFGLCSLSRATGLEQVVHMGPSILDPATVTLSEGLPDSFLRGVGWPDILIDTVPALRGVIRFYDCFISYSTADDKFARKLHAYLQQAGVRCWFAPEDMKIGDKIRDTLQTQVRLHDKLVIVFSESSVSSQWVEGEVETALEQERERGETKLFPIRIDDAVMSTNRAWASDVRRSRNIGDFRHWTDPDAFQTAFDRVLRDLKRGRSEEGG